MLVKPLPRLWPLAAWVGGGLVLLETLQGPLSSLLGLSAAAAGLWLVSGRLRPNSQASLPSSSEAWLQRCEAVLQSFETLDQDGDLQRQEQRRHQLGALRQLVGEPHLRVALVGSSGWSDALQSHLLENCKPLCPLRVVRSHPLPPSSDQWHWPEPFRHCDLIVYRLDLPLKAADLRWLEALPEGQRALLLVDYSGDDWQTIGSHLKKQLPSLLRDQCWPWSPERPEQLGDQLLPLAQTFAALGPDWKRSTQKRCLRELHGYWQGELEAMRRSRWQQMLQRTQWAVAAGVVVSPLPTLDLLVLAAANGLMLQEMARLWNSPWSLEQLQATALHLGKACLSLGVVDWSTQALSSVVKLHGATWLVGGAIQALSAAYLTRVVGRAMADYMALAVGVPEEDLERLLQQQAPLLVARAAEQEKLDWSGFVRQGQSWLQQSPKPPIAANAS